jgi:hypothetical protein
MSEQVRDIITEAREVAKERGFTTDAGVILVLAQAVAYLSPLVSPGFGRHLARVEGKDGGKQRPVPLGVELEVRP